MKADSEPVLHNDYYLHNFLFLLNWVGDRSMSVIPVQAREFIRNFRKLNENGQRLLIRLLMRNKAQFRVDKLVYAEINITAAVETLLANQMVSHVALVTPEAAQQSFTKVELAKLLAQKASVKKAELITMLSDQHQIQLAQAFSLIELNCGPAFLQVRLAFFGNLYQDLSEFVTSALGHVRYEQYQISLPQWNQADFEQWFELSLLEADIHQHIASADDSQCQTWLALVSEYQNLCLGRSRLNKAKEMLAYRLEQLKQYQGALELYNQSHSLYSQERAIRVQEKLGQSDLVLARLTQIYQSESADMALCFALRPIAKRIVKKQPEMQANLLALVEQHQYQGKTETLTLAAADNDCVEQAVCQYYQVQGWQAVHSENQYFQAIIGLAHWDLIFADVSGAFFHPFQRGPVDFNGQFSNNRKEMFLKWSNSWCCLDQLQAIIVENFHGKQGITNPLVNWRGLEIDILIRHLAALSTSQWRSLFAQFWRAPHRYRAGFPDLFVFNDKHAFWAEVKGPGDTLRAGQAEYLYLLEHWQLDVRLVKVNWC